jgi:hypothetical protein
MSRAPALLAVLAVASCNPSHGKLPAARCRDTRDCEVHLVCRDGLCQATGYVEGAVEWRGLGPAPADPLTDAVRA